MGLVYKKTGFIDDNLQSIQPMWLTTGMSRYPTSLHSMASKFHIRDRKFIMRNNIKKAKGDTISLYKVPTTQEKSYNLRPIILVAQTS
jgi:hypothetical protein